jgi:DNA-binding PadR family transcriptional regulator
MNFQLSQSEFYIMLSLAIKSRHGYEIMKQVEQDTSDQVQLGPGTLYGSIKRLVQSELISEVAGDNRRRKYYALTEEGKRSLSAELNRYNDALELAKQNDLLQNFGYFQLAS